MEDLCSYLYTDLFELQTVNNQSKLIYLDRNYNITKMSKNMEIKPNIHRENILNMKTAVCVLVPVHCGSTGRLGLYNNWYKTVKVIRSDMSAQLIQAIQHDNKNGIK